MYHGVNCAVIALFENVIGNVTVSGESVVIGTPPWLYTDGYPINGNLVRGKIGIKIANICINGTDAISY